MTLTELRKEKRLKTVDIATRIGITQGYYSNLERGKRPFNEVLLKKTAKVLGVQLSTLQETVKSQPIESFKLKSWMTNMRIHGLPLIKAFHYYMETNGINLQSLDDVKLKLLIKEFIETNIGYSVLAELSENRNLLSHMREIISEYSCFPKNIVPHHKSKNI